MFLALRAKQYGELSKEVNDDLNDFRSGALKTEASLRRIMEETSHQDDRHILSIEMAMQKSRVDVTDKSLSDQKDKLCATLAGFLADSIRCRLNRMYLETMCASQDNAVAASKEDDDVETSLRSELDSLYEEIRPLVDMAIKQDYAAPLTAAAAERRTRVKTNVSTMLDQVSGPLNLRAQLRNVGFSVYCTNAQKCGAFTNEALQT